MNSIDFTGWLTKDPDISYTAKQRCVASFTLAIQTSKEHTDFPRIKAFDKTAELIEKYGAKGRMLELHGRIYTDIYEKRDGTKSFITEVIAERIAFLGSRQKPEEKEIEPPDDFEAVDDDVPF